MQETFDFARYAIGLKAVVESSDMLSNWTIWTIGGSMAALLGTSYVKPRGGWRAIYIIVVPVLGSLGLSISKGFEVRQAHIAFLLRSPEQANTLEAIGLMNDAFAIQMHAYTVAISALLLWLVVYLFWWVFIEDS